MTVSTYSSQQSGTKSKSLDTFFQRNPFGPEAPKVHGLQVFMEHYTIRTTHWLVDWPVGDCKNIHYDEPMICSGTVSVNTTNEDTDPVVIATW